jgi:hypothetical protein
MGVIRHKISFQYLTFFFPRQFPKHFAQVLPQVSISVAVIMVVSSVDPRMNPILNAGLRFVESCVGTALAVLAVLAWSEKT